MKRNLVLTASLLIGLLLIAACGAAPEQAPPADTDTATETMAESAEETAGSRAQFEETVANYNNIYKKALFSTGQAKAEQAQTITPQSLEAWQNIVANFGETAPPGYGKTENWSATMNEILALEQEAAQQVEASNYQEAHEALESIRKMLREVRLENGITDNISDLMLTFHDEMEIVAEAETLEEAHPHIENLVQYIQPIKQYSDNAQYKEQVNKLDQLVNQLQTAQSQEQFKAAQKKIKPAFIQLYMQHG